MTTPADEMRQAAAVLRQMRFPAAMTATTSTAALIGARLPIADWLGAEANTWAGDEVHNRCTPETCTSEAALAVARAINAHTTA